MWNNHTKLSKHRSVMYSRTRSVPRRSERPAILADSRRHHFYPSSLILKERRVPSQRFIEVAIAVVLGSSVEDKAAVLLARDRLQGFPGRSRFVPLRTTCPQRKLRRCFTPGVNGAKQKLKWRGMLAFKPGLSSLLFTYPCLTALLLHGASSPQMSMSRDIFS